MQAARCASRALSAAVVAAAVAVPGVAHADSEVHMKAFHLAAVERSHGLDVEDDRQDGAGATAAEAVAAVRRRIGAGYASGGTGPGAFDCSGLTLTAYADAGVTLPRVSFDQYAEGTAVGRKEIRPGDLVFFDTSGPGASHVGIAVSRKTVVSATSSGGVMEHPIDDAYWGSSYVGARRLG